MVGQLYLTIPLTGEIADLFGADPATAAWAGAAFGLAYAAGFLVWGPLSDRRGRRIVLLCGLVATAVATALLWTAGSLGWFLAGRALQGFVASSFPPVALALVVDSSIPGARVVRELEALIAWRGAPLMIVSDNVRSSTGRTAPASSGTTSHPVNRSRTPSSRASTPASETNVSTRRSSARWPRPAP